MSKLIVMKNASQSHDMTVIIIGNSAFEGVTPYGLTTAQVNVNAIHLTDVIERLWLQKGAYFDLHYTHFSVWYSRLDPHPQY